MGSSPKDAVSEEVLMLLVRERLAAGYKVRYLPFQGVSMLPMLRQGKDRVELGPLPDRLKKYDLPMYRRGDGKYVIHRIVRVEEGCYICMGDNTYNEERIAPEQMKALVGAFVRGGRRISVEHRGYRLYCRVWCAVYPVRRWMKRVQWWIHRKLKEQRQADR